MFHRSDLLQFDVPRAKEVLAFIEQHPQQYKQMIYVESPSAKKEHSWGPRTRACIAGWTSLLNGDSIVLGVLFTWIRDDQGRTRCPHNRAKELLGLSEGQADWLFWSRLKVLALWKFKRYIKRATKQQERLLRELSKLIEMSPDCIYEGLDTELVLH